MIGNKTTAVTIISLLFVFGLILSVFFGVLAAKTQDGHFTAMLIISDLFVILIIWVVGISMLSYDTIEWHSELAGVLKRKDVIVVLGKNEIVFYLSNELVGSVVYPGASVIREKNGRIVIEPFIMEKNMLYHPYWEGSPPQLVEPNKLIKAWSGGPA